MNDRGFTDWRNETAGMTTATKFQQGEAAYNGRRKIRFACRLAIRLVSLAVAIFLSHPAARAVTFQIVDALEFSRIIDTNAVHTTNATINSWLEGPTWIPSGGGYLVFCDQGNNRLKKIVPPSTVSDFLLPPANTLFNGTILDASEQLLGCQAGSAGLRVVLVTNGVVTPLASTCNGLKFYSPNDVAVKSDGTVWFTDPGYNSGFSQPPVPPGFQTGYYVYRFNPTNGNATCAPVITNGLIRPNGLCFSPDESRLYVADSDTAQHNIRVYTVSASNTLYALTGYPIQQLQVFMLSPTTGAVIGGPIFIGSPAVASADGFTVMPNGNFLINDEDAAPTYREYDGITGSLVSGGLIVDLTVFGFSRGTGVTTAADNQSLYFMADITGPQTIVQTDLAGQLMGFQPINSALIEDIDVVIP